MSKYDPLRRHFASLTLDVWNPSFVEIEAILGFRLPVSARSYPAWWANDPHHSYASTWLGYGWRTEGLNLGAERVTFRRAASAIYRSGRAKSAPATPPVDLSPRPSDDAGWAGCRLGFRWNWVGRVTLDGAGRLVFPDSPEVPALFRFRIRNREKEVISIGETENLARRFGLYRNPGPSQPTNMRMNAKFREALSSGAQIEVAAVLSDAWIERNGIRVEADLSSKVVRGLLENAAILDEGEAAVESLNKAMSPGFSPMEEGKAVTGQDVPDKTGNQEAREDRLSEVVRALDRAERRPGYEFVSLKWFRDSALVHEGLAWAADELARHEALREMIDRRWVLTSKVANPRPPNFPVTAIRLNRRMPAVNAALGGQAASLPAFRPVSIRGESLAATILRDRR